MYKLVIGGKGWDNPEVFDFIRKQGMEDKVIITGFIGEKDVVELLNAASLFIFPSLAEGFGMPNIEAMACGCPVITSNVFAIPEVVGDAAVLLQNPLDENELAEKIMAVLTDEGLRERLVEAGLNRLPLFDWDISARNVLEAYRKLTL